MLPGINSSAGRQHLQGLQYAAPFLDLSGDFVKESLACELLQRKALNPNKCKAEKKKKRKKGKKNDNGYNTSWGRVYLTDKVKKEPQRSLSARMYAWALKTKHLNRKESPSLSLEY